jgi:hypothetical protein
VEGMTTEARILDMVAQAENDDQEDGVEKPFNYEEASISELSLCVLLIHYPPYSTCPNYK